MGSWSPEHNAYLSCLLDEVTGTAEMVNIRRDYCKLHDCIFPAAAPAEAKGNVYYTGSRAEGLDLPGSDDDYMIDFNDWCDIEVSESSADLTRLTRKNKLLIVTDNVPPAFVVLKCVSLQNQKLLHSVVYSDDTIYLGSELFVTASPILNLFSGKKQGPSFETWSEYEDTSENGADHVPSILCKFWPESATEWKDRPRQYGWPSQHDKESIEAFGFHLVPVGHPLSSKKIFEWRLSFSIAERTLVWSFNHTQLQCYAVMKLILKEFIKKKSSEKHKSVLCSYFIKTFLFWQFERTESSFWQPTNLTVCIMYLLNAFYDCIHDGILRHYFVPRFNLLEIKLTPEAQSELLHLLRMVLEIGIPILVQCNSLSAVLSKIHQVSDKDQCLRRKEEILRDRELDNDVFLIKTFTLIFSEDIHSLSPIRNSLERILVAVIRLTYDGHCSTSLPVYAIRHLYRLIAVERLHSCYYQGNSLVHYYTNFLYQNVYGADIASSRLWLATFLLRQGNYCASLYTINNVLSSIPPYALYYCGGIKTGDDSKHLYIETYCSRNTDIICRAKEAWLHDMQFSQKQYNFVTRAIQIELQYGDFCLGVWLSPFTYAYYLMFLCYHGLSQYDNRDRALRQLVETVNDEERLCNFRNQSYNIAGHCMLIAGQVERARSMFLRSAYSTHSLSPVYDKYNAAYKYLSFM